MRRWCRWTVYVLGGLYLIALGLWAVGTFGLFGSPSGPLAGVFLLPLGLPWNLLIHAAPDAAALWLAALAPLVNIGLLTAFCRRGRATASDAPERQVT